MYGIGKKRSKYGRFLDDNKIDQSEVCKLAGINKDTVSKACNEDDPVLRGITKRALVEAARRLSRIDVEEDAFW
jgi:predicted transcriptional regulator